MRPFKIILLCSILLRFGIGNLLYSQKTVLKNGKFYQHVRYGGSVGLNFGDDFFSANLAPKAIYDFNKVVSTGIGLLGAYSNANNYTAFTYGGSVIGLFRPWRAFQLSTEFEELHVSRNFEYDGANIKENYWYPALFVGLGYTRGPVTVGVRYDLLFDENKSIYGNAFMPFVSIYF